MSSRKFLEVPVDHRNRQAHDIEIAALDSRDEFRRATLHRVSASLIHRLTGSHVIGNFPRAQRREPDGGDFVIANPFRAAAQTNAGHHLVALPGKQREHAAGIGGILRLGQDLAVDHNRSVGAQDNLAGTRRDGQRFGFRQPPDVILGCFAWAERFVDGRGANGEWDSCLAQNLCASRRLRC